MQAIEIILTTIGVAMLIEGLLIAIWPKSIIKNIRKIFKNKKQVVKIGLIEVILALLLLFIIVL